SIATHCHAGRQELGNLAIGRVHVGVHWPWVDAVDRDPAWPQIMCQAAVETGHSAYGQAVCGKSGHTCVLGHRAGYVDDTTTCLHVPPRFTGGAEPPGHVSRER